MSDLEKAARDAIEAADNSEMVQQIAAILAAQQLLAQQQPQAPTAPAQSFDAKKWVVIGGVVVSVGMAVAVFAVAVAIGAVCATACLLILRAMWRDYLKGK
ncbi:hypothetical protein HEP81_06528 [Streptomyces griseofuscus]|uniref:Uncharacterized protein n=1 Tax=Streptomyces griseofuscus TaxID=146922 RepID=A0A7H1Q8Y3_9ACTN|nr:hypothetical protein [Streptomyces griseofuscus]QNT96763.1 hypothetical protein HEP81_06528 [Streptomyces griseofuscus]